MEAILIGAGAWLVGWKIINHPKVKASYERKQAKAVTDDIGYDYIRDDNSFSSRRYVDMTDDEVNAMGIEMGPPEVTPPGKIEKNQEREEFDPNTYQDVWRYGGGHDTPSHYEILV